MKRKIPVIIAVVLIFVIVIIAGGLTFMEKFSYSKEQKNLTQYYGLNEMDDVAVVLNQEMEEVKGKLFKGRCYLDLDTVHSWLNDRFYADYNEKLLLYALPAQIISAQFDHENEEGYIPAFMKNETLYIALDYVKKFTNFSYELYKEPNHIVLTTLWNQQQMAEITKDTAVRYQGGIKSDILRELSKDEKVTVLEVLDNWSRIATEDGYIGYVENKRLTDTQTVTPVMISDYQEPEYTNQVRDHKINMVWHQVTTQEANSTLTSALDGVKGVNVISPTWFFLSDNEGNFQNIGSKAYVDAVHSKGMEVWILVDNFTNDVDLKEILSYTSKRARLIQALVESAVNLGAEGINIDFEQVPESAGEDYIQFIRELSVICRGTGLVLSVDNYVPKEYNAHYHWKEQGVFADYVIIMGYDEHWGGSQDAGSVASFNYVNEGIERMVQSVPAEKVINAVPFYTRLWKTTEGQVSSKALGMASAEKFLKDKGVEALWDETTCQNYAEYQGEDGFYQVWLEDSRSLEAKLSIMKKFELGGVAAWKLGYEKGRPEIWDLLEQFVNGS